jgi:hypothetical protein
MNWKQEVTRDMTEASKRRLERKARDEFAIKIEWEKETNININVDTMSKEDLLKLVK